jgi:hypothetical protein
MSWDEKIVMTAIGDVYSSNGLVKILENGTDGTDAVLASALVALDGAVIIGSNSNSGDVPDTILDTKIQAGVVISQFFTVPYAELFYVDSGAPSSSFIKATLRTMTGRFIVESIANSESVPDTIDDTKITANRFDGNTYSNNGLVQVINNSSSGLAAWFRGGILTADDGRLLDSISDPGAAPLTIADAKITAGKFDVDMNFLVGSSAPSTNFLMGGIQANNQEPVISGKATAAPIEGADIVIHYSHLIPNVHSSGSGVWNNSYDLIILGSGNAVTGFTPAYIGQRVTVYCTDSTADATLVGGAGVTFDGTNDVATFANTGDALELRAVSLTRWLVLVNIGTVLFT